MPSQPPTPFQQPPSASNASLSIGCAEQLQQLAEAGRLRTLRTVQPMGKHVTLDGRTLVNLASNDYLALSQHPKLIDAAIEATRAFGVGSGASRLVSGNQPLHRQAEQRFARFKHAQAALLVATGYTANLAVLTSLAEPGDLILLDKLVHASLIDAAKASGAQVRTYPHLQLDRAEQLLKRHTTGRRFLVTDSIFSMDGDCADLPACCELADGCDASLIIDEAHGTGVLGNDGSGLAAAQGVAQRVYTAGTGGIVISTASKALGSLGGLVTADQPIIDLLINKARPFIYSTAVPPAQAACLLAAIEVVHGEPHRREHLHALIKRAHASLIDAGWPLADTKPTTTTPIIPLVVGREQDALHLADRLNKAGFFAPAIRPPTVAPGSSRVRLSLRADLTAQDIDQLVKAIGQAP